MIPAPIPLPARLKSRIGTWSARVVCRYAGWILAGLFLLCVLAFPFAKKLQLHANFVELLPRDTPSVVNLKNLTSHVGGTSFLICVMESPDEETARVAAEKFVAKAAKFPGVDYADNRTNVPAFEGRKLLFMNLESVQKLKNDILDWIGYYRRAANPLFIDLLNEKAPEIDVSSYEPDHKVYRIGGFASRDKSSFMRVVLIKPSHTVGDFAKSRVLFDRANAAFEEIRREMKHPVTMGMTGPYRTREAEYRTMSRDVYRTGMLTTLLIALIMMAAFRNFRCLIYALVPLSAGIFLTFAWTQMTIGHLNFITAFMVSLLLGMGSDYTLHMLVSIEDDLKTQRNVYAALKQTYNELWRPLLSSMLTTAAAFYAMGISTFEGFRHFGMIAGAGIVISFVVVYFGLPSLVVIGQKYFPLKPRKVKRLNPISKTGVSMILIAGFLFSLYSLLQLPKLSMDYNFLNLQAKGDDAIELAERIGNHFGVQLNPVGFITPNRERADEITQQLDRYIQTHPDTSFDFAASLSSHVPRHQEEKIKVLGEIEEILKRRESMTRKLKEPEKSQIRELRRQLKAAPLTLDDLPVGLKRQYEGDDRQISAVFIYPKGRIVDGRVTERFVRELRSLDFGPGIKMAGDPVIFADVLFLLEKDTPVVMLISLITVIGLLFIHFRRPDHVLWVLAPVVVGFLWMIGMAGAAHLSYNFINMTIIPSVLGVGIDSGIYIFDHYRTKRKDNFFVSMQKTSKGVILSSVTNIAAFASLAFAAHRGMASMGLLGVFGFFSCLLAAVYFVPALIEHFEYRKQHVFDRSPETKQPSA